ncbi:unnamed protein product [Meloidogyne enterolobii]|uniref:Uncharacterized protein n=1 Tax=Meloidogyne enterolobii TaxID=390850 RepID=A0ACB1A633_MELEN
MTRNRQRTHHNINIKQNSISTSFQRQQLIDSQYSLNEESKYFESELNGYLFSFLHIEGINEFSFPFPLQKINSFLLQQLILSRLIILLFQCTINFVMRDSPTDAFKGINRPENNEGLFKLIFLKPEG